MHVSGQAAKKMMEVRYLCRFKCRWPRTTDLALLTALGLQLGFTSKKVVCGAFDTRRKEAIARGRLRHSSHPVWVSKNSASALPEPSTCGQARGRRNEPMLVLSRKVGEELVIGENIRVVVHRIAGNRVTIGIEAPHDVRIVRGELQMQEESLLDHAEHEDYLGRYAHGGAAVATLPRRAR